MKLNKNHQKNLMTFNKRIKLDSELIKRRFATTDKKHQLLLRNPIVLGETTRRDRNVSNKTFLQAQVMQERVCLESGIPSLANFHSFSPFLIPGTLCNLDNNLQLGGLEGLPRKLYYYSQDDPPEDLDEKFYFDDLTTDSASNSYSFTLNSIFPLTPACYTHTVAYFDFKFIFPIGSSGTYCFLPLIKFLGNISYFTSGSLPGSFGIVVQYGVIQNGEVLGASRIGQYGVELNNAEQITLSLGTDDFNYDRLMVNLESEYMIAEIPVIIILAFYNSSFHSYGNDDVDGHFILDCVSQGGNIACNYIKWGRQIST